MPEYTPRPEDLYAEHKRLADELEKVSQELPEDEHVQQSRQQIQLMEQAIETFRSDHPNDLVPQDLYGKLAEARSGLMKYRLTIRDIKKVVKEHALESDLIGSRIDAEENLAEWREQAQQEMLDEIRRDDNNSDIPSKEED